MGRNLKDQKNQKATGKYETELLGFPVIGHEEDYIRGLEPLAGFGVSQLIEKATGMDPASWSESTAFEYPTEKQWKREIKSYRKRTGRKYPPIFKMKFSVQAEKLPEAKISAYWRGVEKKYILAKKQRAAYEKFRSKELAKSILAGLTEAQFNEKYKILVVHKTAKKPIPQFELVENNTGALRLFFSTKGDPEQAKYYLPNECDAD